MKKRPRNQRLWIRIKNSQRKIIINKKTVIRLAKQVLKIKGINNAELSILFAGKARIRALNKKFRKIDRPTDVLAFPMGGVHPVRKSFSNGAGPEILGDVVICPEIAGCAASIYKTTKEEEIYLCLIHGILHLLGYDDTSSRDRSLMEKEQAKILKKWKDKT